MTLVAVLDYGIGNLRSAEKALQHLGADAQLTGDARAIADARAVVLPGVGAFGACMHALRASGLEDATRAAATDGRPFMGICVGMQMLFEGSDEANDVTGLGLLPGRCFRLSGNVKVPHVGWNTLDAGAARESRLLAGLPAGASAYFTHSYAAPIGAASAAVTTHGVPFASAVETGRTFGVQFHPEKSGATGLRMLENFLAVVREGR